MDRKLRCKIGLGFQSIPGWAKVAGGAVNVEWVKFIDPPDTNPVPGCKAIARVYIPDGEANRLVAMGAAGADIYFARCLPNYQRAPWVHAWEAPNEPPVGEARQRAALVAFTQRWSARMHEINRKAIALCLSVGWPNIGEAPDLAGAIAACDYWAVHEYAAPRLMDGGGMLTLRYRHTVAELTAAGVAIKPLFITELNVDGGTLKPAQPRVSWRTYYHGDVGAFLADLDRYDTEIQQDDYVVSALMFVAGPGGEWTDFDCTEDFVKGLHQVVDAKGAYVPPPPPLPTDLSTLLAAKFGAKFHDWRATMPRNQAVPWFGKRPLDAITKIEWHHTAVAAMPWTQVAQGELAEHPNWPSCPYHFGVDQDGSVWYLGDISEWRGHTNNAEANRTSIGISSNGNFDPTGPKPLLVPTAELIDAYRRLKAVLETYLGHALAVEPHRAVDLTACPGTNIMAVIRQVDGEPPPGPQAPPDPPAIPTIMPEDDEATLAKATWWAEEIQRWEEWIAHFRLSQIKLLERIRDQA